MIERSLNSLTEKGSGFVVHLSEFIFGGVIGKGGFGEVRKAVQISTQRYCASKQIFSSRIEGQKFKRYVSEIETMLKCDNMFLIPLVGFTIEPPYTIITEYMPGGTLDKALRPASKKDPLSPTQLTMIAMGIANGMMELHANNIIHRDLKTANVLLNANKLPAIIDFGISRTESANHQQTAGIGTPQYMAPELISSTKYDKKVDVYSFAMILYEMSELTKPFNELSITEIFQRVVDRGDRPDFSDRTPENLRKLIRNCWDQEPSNRPTFEAIYQEFCSGRVAFPGTDPKKISKFVEHIKIESQQRGEKQRIEAGSNELTHLLINFMEETSQTPVLSKGEKNQISSDPPSTVLSNFQSPLFERYLTYYSETIESAQFFDFYTPLSKNFSKKNLTPEKISSIAKSCNLLMKRNSNFAKLFLDAKYFEDIPLKEGSVDDVISSFTILMTEYPDIVNNTITAKVTELCKLRPEKMIVIISFFLKCEKKGDIFFIIHVLINISEFMFTNNCGYLYLSLLMNVATSNLDVSQKDAEKIKKILLKMMESPIPRTRACAYVAISKLLEDIQIEYNKLFLDDLNNEITRDACLALIARLTPNPPPTDLYNNLLNCLEYSPRSWIYFLRIAETKMGSSFLAKRTEWSKFVEKLPTEVCRLFLVLLSQENARETILEQNDCVLSILSHVLDVPGDDAFDAISIIIPVWTKNKQKVTQISNLKILHRFFGAALSGSFRAKRCALAVAEAVGKLCFTEELVTVAKSIESALQERELAGIAIQVTSTLSQYSQCKALFHNEELIKFFKNLLSYPAYEHYAKIFLSNMEKK
ncbi:TKL family protein kinase [Trichomonas vaginalis G3]|uniref:TKL family protein kinase n=1 Tax=Trichomonas vaginalis (strain ATCC PRA-98 / G3) TaxID=412133 RepID=A2E9E2_TRIV3|nr:protein kinase protein [Trichomonas vaginalis G3]EAY10706.1 TKL family protein kinase [Trichomonas vaginalis G3]KAI5538599.1 protein kinase protein [Trichomonas vaginalis G3]|eukprot:XP_001322929.1 TKL family protein kinase [Trichomonas vaginalis G3]